MKALSHARNSFALALLRIAVGVLFIIFGEYKVFGREFVFGGGFSYWINRFLQDGAYPFMVPVLRGFVLRHTTSLALLVAYGELAIGLSLMLGMLTRIAAAAGFIYMMALLFSSNYPGAHVPLWHYFGASLDHSALALCFAAFVVGDSESKLSIRALMGKRS